jgi:hypothetical protein
LPPGVTEAAAALAAHDILFDIIHKSDCVDAALASLAAVADGTAKTDGVTLGASVATQIWNFAHPMARY